MTHQEALQGKMLKSWPAIPKALGFNSADIDLPFELPKLQRRIEHGPN